MRRSLGIVLAAIILIPSAGSSVRRAGALDPSFGPESSGFVTSPFGSSNVAGTSAVGLQPDGKIVVAGLAGGIALIRYTRKGSLDQTFGSGGVVRNRDAGAADVAIQPNGKIVIADNGSGSFRIARYEPNGSRDLSFGVGGTATALFADCDGASAGKVALQPNGKIVAAGACQQGYTLALARYQPDGSVDSRFGTDGTVTGGPLPWGLALQPDGKIVVAGGGQAFFLNRFNPDGSLDRSFGADGSVTTPFGSSFAAFAHAVAVQRDGKIVAAGEAGGPVDRDIALTRYDVDGNLDPSFGSGGVVTTSVGPTSSAAAVLLQRDGKIVAIGSSGPVGEYWPAPNPTSFALVRYRPAGTLDTAFGKGGKVTTLIGGSSTATAALLQPDGKIVASGVTTDDPTTSLSNRYFAVARYLGAAVVCRVPNVIRKSVASARLALSRAHCSLGSIKQAFSNSVKKGRVISQRPRPGTRAAPGAKVNLVVSVGRG